MATPPLNILTAPSTGTAVDVSKLTSPDIEAAKKGIAGKCFDVTVTVTTGVDAAFVKYDPSVAFDIRPDIDWATAQQFCTLEQAAALKALIEALYPGSNLTLYDNIDFFATPGYRRLVYLNFDSLYTPRIYKITGTLKMNGEDKIVEIQVGRMIGFERYATTWPGYPAGTDTITFVMVAQMPRLIWIGKDK